MSKEITDDELQQVFHKVALSNDMSKATDLSVDDVSELLDLKFFPDFDVSGFSDGLDEVETELKDSAKALAKKYGGDPFSRVIFQNAIKDSSLRRHLQNIESGLRLVSKLKETYDLDDSDDLLSDACNLMLYLVRVRVASDLAPIIARGLYAGAIKSAVEFWEQNKDSAPGRLEATWQKELASRHTVLSRALGGNVVLLGEQQHVGASGLSGSGTKITDYLLTHQKTANVTLVEIKTPHTPLLGKEYRGTYPLSEQLSGTVAQVLIQRNELMKNFHLKRSTSGIVFEVDAPRCVVIAGSAENELTDQTMAAAFEIQREALSGRVRLLTFDELYGQFAAFNMVD